MSVGKKLLIDTPSVINKIILNMLTESEIARTSVCKKMWLNVKRIPKYCYRIMLNYFNHLERERVKEEQKKEYPGKIMYWIDGNYFMTIARQDIDDVMCVIRDYRGRFSDIYKYFGVCLEDGNDIDDIKILCHQPLISLVIEIDSNIETHAIPLEYINYCEVEPENQVFLINKSLYYQTFIEFVLNCDEYNPLVDCFDEEDTTKRTELSLAKAKNLCVKFMIGKSRAHSTIVVV